MNYYERIQKVIDYIEINLKEELDSEELADIAMFSKSHFLMIFEAYTGCSVMAYVRKRRLSMAAERIRESSDNIADIACEFCFESHDVFGRAFKRIYGITPDSYRKKSYLLPSFEKINLQNIVKEKEAMIKANIVSKPIIHLIGIERIIEDGGITPGQVWDLYYEKWSELFGNIANRVNPEEEVDIAICLDRNEEGLTYFVGFEVSSLGYIPDGTVGRTIPETKCAMFTSVGKIPEAIIKTYDYIYKEWFPESDYQIASDSVCAIEYYDKRCASDKGIPPEKHEMDIYIPIEPVLSQTKEVVNLPSFKAAYYIATGAKNDWIKIKKEAFNVIIDWAIKNKVYNGNQISIYAMNGSKGNKFWYEVFVNIEGKNIVTKEIGIVKTKIYEGGLCIVGTTIHRMLEPTGKAMEIWCGKSKEYKQVYRHWYEEFIVEDGIVGLDTIVKLHMWVEDK